MKLRGAVVTHQGSRFALVEAGAELIDSQTESAEAFRFLARVFPGVPILLMATDSEGRPRYRGPAAIVSKAASLPISGLRWRDFEVN